MALSECGSRLIVREEHLPQLISERALQNAAIQEIDADIPLAMDDARQQQQLSQWLGRQAAAHRGTLCSLRLSGPLCLASVFGAMAPWAAEFALLETVYLCRGGADWQPAAAARTLHRLPSLQRLQIRFSLSEEAPPQDLVSLLLLPRPAPLAPAAAAAAAGLQQLRHLALIYPIRSVVPPTEALPDAMSTLTQLTALKMKRLPVVAEPQFLGALTQLRYLLWDPALPADTRYVMPPGLERLTKLECLWIVTQTPLQLPTSLAANLQGLHVIGRGFHEEQRQLLRWDWLGPFKLLRGMRLQGVGLEALPPEVIDKSLLTRLDLMCNQLEELPAGPYLHDLQQVHLGNNHLAAFPSALLQAKKLEALYLANQSSSSARSSPGGGMPSAGSSPIRCAAGFTRRLEMTGADVEGLLALPSLHTVVMGNLQPVVRLGAAQHDFTWLQRVLKRRGVRLTSEELAYQLQTKAVFEVLPLAIEEGEGEAGGAALGAGNGQEKAPASAPRLSPTHSHLHHHHHL